MSISGFGHDGPEGGRAGYDQITWGEAGLMSVGSGRIPSASVVPIMTSSGHMNGAFGVVAAVGDRERAPAAGASCGSVCSHRHRRPCHHRTNFPVGGKVGQAQGKSPSLDRAPRSSTADGLSRSPAQPKSLWSKFATTFDIDPAAEGMATNRERRNKPTVVVAVVNAALAVLARLRCSHAAPLPGVPAGKVRSTFGRSISGIRSPASTCS